MLLIKKECSLETIVSELSNKYEQLICIRDFNMATSNPILNKFLNTFALSPLDVDPTCVNNSKNSGCINLLRTNFKPSFMKTNVFETVVSGYHKMISTITKLYFTKESPKTKYHGGYRKFDIDYFSSELSRQLDSTLCFIKKNEAFKEFNEFSWFHIVFLNLLNIQVPLKKKMLRGNNSPFMR